MPPSVAAALSTPAQANWITVAFPGAAIGR